MKVAVLMRLVPNLSEGVELNEDQTDIEREWADTQANETDEQALEEALVLKETCGAEVTAIALSDEGVERYLRTALAKGADQVVELDTDLELAQGFSALSTAPMLAGWLKDKGYDLILTGNQKVDDAFGGLASHLAIHLDLPVIAGVTRITAQNGMEALQEYGEGKSSWIGFDGPAVLAVQTASRPIRYVSGSKLREAMASTAYVKESLEAELVEGPGLTLSVPEASGEVEIITDAAHGAARVIALLQERNLI